ncbi:MAG: hypothetical protein CBC65_000470 [Rhodothermaceae bacterium TMED105]|nr:MAG: hypothetical protein CBC65_000470 [Rhodothermaceae bacterium TMED105]|tara:strand:+ start:3139 stop:5205 length:2067 start_codon:yes stop_codon:yes gene_type:complete
MFQYKHEDYEALKVHQPSYDACMHHIETGTSTVYDVEGVKFYIRVEPAPRKAVSTLLQPYKCNACKERAKKFITLHGPDGPVFLESIPESVIKCEPVLVGLRDLAKKLRANDDTPPELVLVENGTFPPVNEGVNAEGVPWKHPTITPNSVTDPEVARKFSPLWKEYGNTMDDRLAKIIDPDPRHARSITIVLEAARKSDHPEHWERTIQWIIGINSFVANIASESSFGNMTAYDKMRMRVYALMTGSFHEGTHYDFHKSENIIDFIQKGLGMEAVVGMMNGRRDERTYQISQVARAMEKAGVTDERTVSLSWNTHDDLDIHMKTPDGACIWYGNAKKYISGCRLNFDANASGCTSKTTEPVENISVIEPQKGYYTIYVNNYETTGCDVPFQITIKVSGEKDRVWDGVWKASMGSNSGNDKRRMICVCYVEFVNSKPEPIAMSDKEASRARATNDLWEKNIGDVTCRFATFSDAAAAGWTLVPLTKDNSPSDPYMALANKEKSYLCDKLDIPTTLTDLVSHVQSTKKSLFVRVYDVSPAYFVTHHSSNATFGDATFTRCVPCHYRDQGYVPMEPTKRGNARLNGEWFNGLSETSFARVNAVLHKEGHPSFISLEGIRVPNGSPHFPLGGGFYPTLLKPKFHELKSRWTAKNTLCTPPQTLFRGVAGGFVFGEHTFYLGDQKKEVRISSV